jgi:hypothetical protein
VLVQVVPRHRLLPLLRAAGLETETRDFPEVSAVHRLTVREAEPMPFTGGPHRKLVYADGRVEGPFPVADRPVLSQFIAETFTELGIKETLATIPEGAFWLNNKAQAAYLWKVDDARRVSRFLRRRGLTDRFRGGFRVRREQFAAVLPVLAAHTYAGGADVLFAALEPPQRRLTALACHHYDIHFASPDRPLLDSIAHLAAQHGLTAETLALPDIPDTAALWT